jgi:hypothetical protein
VPFTQIEVEDREEASLIKKGLGRADVRALVKVMGALQGLSIEEATRVLTLVRKRYGIE